MWTMIEADTDLGVTPIVSVSDKHNTSDCVYS